MFSTRTSCATAAFLLALSRHVRAGAIVGDGEVILGIRNCAALNEPYIPGLLPKTDPAGINVVGIRNKNAQLASIGVGQITGVERGCLCEGWTVMAYDDKKKSYNWCGDNAAQNGPFNIRNDDCEINSGDEDFVSVAECLACGNKSEKETFVKVTHYFHPSAVPELYEVNVVIENPTNKYYASVEYRRSFDWDIDPSPFQEFVTHSGAEKCPAVNLAVDNGFCQQDPNLACNQLYASGDFVNVGPYDHGSTFQVNLGPLAPKGEVQFTFYYGLSPGKCDGWISPEMAMLQALQDVGANVYSLGQKNTNPLVGDPFTFAFGFRCPKTPKVKYPFEKVMKGKDDLSWADPHLGEKYFGKDDLSWADPHLGEKYFEIEKMGKDMMCREITPDLAEFFCSDTITKLKCPESCAEFCIDSPRYIYSGGVKGLEEVTCETLRGSTTHRTVLCGILDVMINCPAACGECGMKKKEEKVNDEL